MIQTDGTLIHPPCDLYRRSSVKWNKSELGTFPPFGSQCRDRQVREWFGIAPNHAPGSEGQLARMTT